MTIIKKFTLHTRTAWALLLMVLCILPANAQFIRSSYFMEDSHYRMQLNPALTPTHGFINIPVIGALGVSATSNSLNAENVSDVIDNSGDFSLLNDLPNMVRANVNLTTDIVSLGWYKGKNFWSVNVGLRVDVGEQIPKSMFQFLNHMNKETTTTKWDNVNFDIADQKFNINSYAEIGVGYARPITDRLTVGGRVKLLLGVGNLSLKINKMAIKSNISTDKWVENGIPTNEGASYAVDAELESSFKGLELKNGDKGYVDDMKLGGYGLAGYGGAIDFGASYKLTDRITLSASVLDLGLISWSKGSSSILKAKSETTIDTNSTDEERKEFEDDMTSGKVIGFDMMKMDANKSGDKSRTTMLYSTVVVGGEYAINNWLGVGALSTTRFSQPNTLTELTLSANMRPLSWFNATVSYSMIQSLGKSVGFALKLGPLFLGTDYMYFGDSSKAVNGFIGLSIPLGKKKG